MRRPSFQFYPADWQSNLNLKRCNFRLRGIWLEVMCLFHASDEYGMVRWTLNEIANSIGCTIEDLNLLVKYKILKGIDKDGEKVSFSDTFSQKNRVPISITLFTEGGPLWYSSRMVRDEYIRIKRAKGGIKSLENQNVPASRKKDKDTLSPSFSLDKVSLSPSFSGVDKVSFSPSPTSTSTSTSINTNTLCSNSKNELERIAKKSLKNQQNKKKLKTFSVDSWPYKLAKLLFDCICKNDPNPQCTEKDIPKWAIEMDLLIRKNKRDPKEIALVIKWVQNDRFNKSTVLSAGKLRKRYPELRLKMRAANIINSKIGEHKKTDQDLDAIKRVDIYVASMSKKEKNDALDQHKKKFLIKYPKYQEFKGKDSLTNVIEQDYKQTLINNLLSIGQIKPDEK